MVDAKQLVKHCKAFSRIFTSLFAVSDEHDKSGIRMWSESEKDESESRLKRRQVKEDNEEDWFILI